MATADDIRDLQRQIVELRASMELADQRHASLIEYHVAREISAKCQGRLPSAEVLAWCERGYAASLERAKSIREVMLHTVKLSAWSGLAFIVWSVWESLKTKIGVK